MTSGSSTMASRWCVKDDKESYIDAAGKTVWKED